jgi:alpha-glucosidase
VAAQRDDPASTLALYRAALHLRRDLPALHTAPLGWASADDDVLAFDRGPTFRCVVNLSARPVDLTGQGSVLLASAPCAGELPPDTAVWLSRPGDG